MLRKHAFLQYVALFLGFVLAGMTVLYAVGLIPQEKIHQNIAYSAVQFAEEGEYPWLMNIWNDTYKLDAFSESLIINHAYYMDTRESPSSIVENLHFRNGEHPVGCLLELAENPDAPGNSERARYWLGFRAYVRPLLSLMPYQDIRGVLSILFFSLMLAALITIRDRANTVAAACFALTVLAMNPVIVSTSLQYSCCFLIAFAGIWAVCRRERSICWLYGAFMVIGQATMFFDFYTAPLITWGLPFVALVTVERSRRKPDLRGILGLLGATFAMWIVGYAGMWILKMILNTLFTEQNGFKVLLQFLYYTGITETPSDIQEYTAWQALYECLRKVFTVQNRFVLCASIPVLAVCFVRMRRHKKYVLGDRGIWAYAAAAVLPVAWILCSRQASGVHSYFQYRTLAVAVYAGLSFLSQILEKADKPSRLAGK